MRDTMTVVDMAVFYEPAIESESRDLITSIARVAM